MYKQTDYPGLTLGINGPSVAKEGCLAIDWVNALNLAGYDITPSQFIDNMNTNSGFVTQGDNKGALIWEIVQKLYPQVHLGNQGFTFQEGKWGTFSHWLLEHNGTIYDPWFGLNEAPSGWVIEAPFNEVKTASIDSPNPQPTPPVPGSFVAHVLRTCNVRTAPHLNAPLGGSKVLYPGNVFTGINVVTGDMVSGNNAWIESSKGNFVWSGNLSY